MYNMVMGKIVTATEAKNNFGELIYSVTTKENTVTITRHNKPIAKIVPITPPKKRKKSLLLTKKEILALEKATSEFRETFKFSFKGL